MHDRWGEAAVERVDNTIAEYASPDAGSRVRSSMDKALQHLRGIDTCNAKLMKGLE